MLERYVAKLDPDDEPVGVERTVALKTDHAALFGRVDRIDERPGEGLVIVDYKTGRQVLTLDDARSSLALAIYALGAARTLRRPCRRVELHHLPTGDVLAWDHTDDGLARHLRRADSIAREIAALDERFRAGLSAEEADRLYPAVGRADVRLVRLQPGLPAGRPRSRRAMRGPGSRGRFAKVGGSCNQWRRRRPAR